MGQAEIFKYLKNKRRWVNTRELSRIFDIRISTISVSLRKLQKYEPNIEMKERAAKYGGNLWRYKKRNIYKV